MTFILTLGLTQPPVYWIPNVILLLVKWPRHEANLLPAYSTKVKNMWKWTFTTLLHLCGMVLD